MTSQVKEITNLAESLIKMAEAEQQMPAKFSLAETGR